MKREVISGQIPSGYPICTSESYSERTHCLHAHFASQVLGGERTLTLINNRYPRHQEGKACELYCPDNPEHYAKRLTRAMGGMSYNNYAAFTDYLIAKHMKTQFYRIKHSDIPLSPMEQTKLQALLRTYGCMSEKPFDSYKVCYT